MAGVSHTVLLLSLLLLVNPSVQERAQSEESAEGGHVNQKDGSQAGYQQGGIKRGSDHGHGSDEEPKHKDGPSERSRLINSDSAVVAVG